MTRVLSELLGAGEPLFQLNLRQLEGSAGRPNADIRLTTEVQNAMRSKLQELGLDPNDTTGKELYTALGSRLADDEVRFVAALSSDSKKPAEDIIGQVAFRLQQEAGDQACFALKSTVAKRLLKANLPKKAMKQLGYRSADSMFKHEPVASLYAAAWLIENDQWTKKMVAAYAKLRAADFEVRKLSIEHPSSKRWHELSEAIVSQKRHHVLAFKELGSVVLLPLPDSQPSLPALSTAVLTVHAMNEVMAASAYLKLHQVQAGFGTVVKNVVTEEAMLEAKLLDQPVSWSLMQQYYARFKQVVKIDLLEPLVQADDLAWHPVEVVLARIEPSLEFWQGTGHLGLLDQASAVSCNLTDSVLSHCNSLPYAERFVGYFRSQLMTELLLRYLRHEHVEQTINGQLQQQLAYEPALA